jgi:nucleotide-binding universal stress UspA family protein
MYDEIVVPLDLSEASTRAFGPAQWLQSRTGARVVVVHAVPDARHRSEARDRLHAALPAELQAVADVVVEHSYEPPDLVTEIARRQARSVVCMATRGHGRVAETLLGSVARSVVQAGIRPTLLVGPRVDGPSAWDSIVACTDGLPSSAAMLDVAADWAGAFGLGLSLVHVRLPVPMVVEMAAPGGLSRSEPAPDLRDEDLARLAADHARPGVEPKWEFLFGGHAAEEVCRYARAHAGSLLAVGTHGRSGLARVVLGSVAQRIVHGSPAPVLVVRQAADGD